MSTPNQNALAQLTDGWKTRDELAREAEWAAILAEANARHERSYRRVEKWAIKQSKEELVAALSLAVVERVVLRSAYRQSKDLARTATDAAGQVRQELDAHLRSSDRTFELLQPYIDAAAKAARDRRKGAATRLARDPKQAAKAGALALWIERHDGKQKKLRTVEQFATEVMRRWPVLESSKVIAKWSAAWTKEVREGRTPSI